MCVGANLYDTRYRLRKFDVAVSAGGVGPGCRPMPTKLVIWGEARNGQPGVPSSLLNPKAPLLEACQVDSGKKRGTTELIDY